MATTKESNMEILHCKNGDHEWTREKKRGPKPVNCPDHKTTTVVKKAPGQAMREGRAKKSAEDRHAKITEIIAHYTDCYCGIKPETTDEELYFMKGCQERFVCPALARVRNAVGLHDIDTALFWVNRKARKQ